MEIYQAVIQFISRNEPVTAVDLAKHFQWSDTAKRQWIEALRTWSWVTTRGKLELTDKGKAQLTPEAKV